jgi:hypothetical protein
MAETEMTLNDLLHWATDETRLADALEGSMADFGTMIGLDMEESIRRHRERSRWLDRYVAARLDEKEKGRE